MNDVLSRRLSNNDIGIGILGYRKPGPVIVRLLNLLSLAVGKVCRLVL